MTINPIIYLNIRRSKISNRITKKDIAFYLKIINNLLRVPDEPHAVGKIVAVYCSGHLSIKQISNKTGGATVLGYFINKQSAYCFLTGMIKMYEQMKCS